MTQDIPRTFPMHPLFCSGVLRSSDASKEVVREEAPLAASLRRVLLAISVLREDIGYCQGFNLLAGFLLIVMMDEEKVFWTLAGLLQYVFPSGYFDSSLSGARVDEVGMGEACEVGGVRGDAAEADAAAVRADYKGGLSVVVLVAGLVHEHLHQLPACDDGGASVGRDYAGGRQVFVAVRDGVAGNERRGVAAE